MKYIFANWKMYLDFDETLILANALLREKIELTDAELAIFPSNLAVREVSMSLGASSIAVGAQNSGYPEKGAYTGLVSAQMFAKVGCKYSLVGHSERRYIFGETNEDVRKKIEICFDAGLIPVLCIGETEKDVKEDKREYRLKKQIMAVFDNLNLDNNDIIIVYEPVWAIGTGKNCDFTKAEEVHAMIKQELKNYTKKEISVIYGGSVNDKNVKSYISLKNVDGVLVGGASTKLETFLPIIKEVQSLSN